ncbi:MAG TPA: class I SAM-dependent methyltransferase [Ktedonobacteraceae bacterium]|nr:class I SAM-dependent methyltransferase [Ktedonobacteraceae bacterium]
MLFGDAGRTGSRYDEVTFQEMVIVEMGELLPVELIDACDLENARSVLEIGCGAGEWLRSIARDYPQLQCIGIDQDEAMVSMANALAQQEGLSQVGCFASDLNSIAPDLFPLEKFDLVHISFAGRFVMSVDYAGLARTCMKLCRPGGFVCWTEGELPVTNSPAFERLVGLLCEALDEAGQSFIPESMWELSALLAKSRGSIAVDRAHFKRRLLGITPMLGLWLREAGRGMNAASSERMRRLFKYSALPQKPYAILLSSRSIMHKSFVHMAARLLREVRRFLLRMGVISEAEYDELCARVEKELAAEDFCGLAFVVRVWSNVCE